MWRLNLSPQNMRNPNLRLLSAEEYHVKVIAFQQLKPEGDG